MSPSLHDLQWLGLVANVAIIDPTWEMVATSVISWSIGVATKLNAIVEIQKLEGFMRGTTLF